MVLFMILKNFLVNLEKLKKMLIFFYNININKFFHVYDPW